MCSLIDELRNDFSRNVFTFPGDSDNFLDIILCGLVSRGVAERLTGSGSPRTIFLANTKPIATPSMTERTTRWL